MKIISFNVNGIRSAIRKGFLDWLMKTKPDILCLQEVKATEDQFELHLIKEMGYDTYFFPAEKKGYSGVAIFTLNKPLKITYGCSIKEYDKEGRILRVDFKDFSVMNVYFPSGTTGEIRQAFKMKWLSDFYKYSNEIRKEFPFLLIGGDFNICHKPIDIHNPVANAKSSGFLPEEREWFTGFFQNGFIDTFRMFNQEPHQYTWWSYRVGARERNLGWRIDYLVASQALKKMVKRALILKEVHFSDHCPVMVEISD
ncbi:MAG: exodeoxyribonuclease III [Bacteroidetes bacterium RIFCSPLOWO2_12_FULL_37_12]|nr:MAG: exodeoxyribonuclease III [Bacteroidetes bacterium RIFCSPLOWO2_12_FULL_37_12]